MKSVKKLENHDPAYLLTEKIYLEVFGEGISSKGQLYQCSKYLVHPEFREDRWEDAAPRFLRWQIVLPLRDHIKETL